jgi:hypothetical protein
MTYKIVGFNETSGSLLVKFAENMQAFGIDVPLNAEGLYITGQELEQYIEGFAPTDFINRNSQIAAGIANVADIQALVVEDTQQTEDNLPIVLTPEEIANQQMWRDLQFKKNIAKVLVEFGVLTTDPTEIPNTTL